MAPGSAAPHCGLRRAAGPGVPGARWRGTLRGFHLRSAVGALTCASLAFLRDTGKPVTAMSHILFPQYMLAVRF